MRKIYLFLIFACFPVFAEQIRPDFFGLHIAYWGVGTPWPSAKFDSWRLHDAYGTKWFEINPQRGQWNFKELDRYVSRAKSQKIDLILTLGQTPRWASARPDEAQQFGLGVGAEPSQMQYWDTYVRNIVKRYRGKIKYYEIWNEPRFLEIDPAASGKKVGYYSGSGLTMIKMAQRAYSIIKSIDPEALIISPSFDGEDVGIKKLEFYLDNGGAEVTDIVGFHFYSLTSSYPEVLPSLIEKVKYVLSSRGLDKVPIWNTEFGYINAEAGHDDTTYSETGTLSVVLNQDKMRNYVARSLILGAASGLGRFYWLSWDSSYMGLLRNHRSAGVMGEGAKSWVRVRKWLIGNDVSCSNYNLVYQCTLIDGKHNLKYIYWRENGTSVVKMDKTMNVTEWERLDGLTGRISSSVTLSEQPILLK